MASQRTLLLLKLFILSALCLTTPAEAKYLFKVATIAPEGSVWTQRFNDFTEEVAKQSNNEVQFKVYTGGIMGDDQAMYRKMRIGQLHGGGFTMTGIGSVVPDFRVMGVPFSFAPMKRWITSARDCGLPSQRPLQGRGWS